MKECHEKKWAGHNGWQRRYALLKEGDYWPSLRDESSHFVPLLPNLTRAAFAFSGLIENQVKDFAVRSPFNIRLIYDRREASRAHKPESRPGGGPNSSLSGGEEEEE
ncbi:reverse transcriptase [Cucumis melo var. makuwa]|uniref:Reverse transcriptase n=1 Tax=Cucumis melo var. makuwa TaxID=1194695 RepID=A0A5A7SU91_CUCMM|nr:reverse transcriptase [Cucumis melo var. makuwa]